MSRAAQGGYLRALFVCAFQRRKLQIRWKLDLEGKMAFISLELERPAVNFKDF
jgi:hypothetical protein